MAFTHHMLVGGDTFLIALPPVSVKQANRKSGQLVDELLATVVGASSIMIGEDTPTVAIYRIPGPALMLLLSHETPKFVAFTIGKNVHGQGRGVGLS